MAKMPPIEFRKLAPRRSPTRPIKQGQSAESCLFLQVFYNFYIYKCNSLVLTKHLVNF
jgi:hypothetical protein